MLAGNVREFLMGTVALGPGAAAPIPGAAEPLAQAGGVQKGQELLNSQAPNSSGKTGSGVQKVGPFLNEQEGVKIGAVDSPRDLANVLDDAQAPKLPALVPIGTTGRPRVLTPELTEKLYMLLSVGFSRRQAASYLGISHGTISNVAKENPEFAAELRRAEELTALQSEMTIMAAARKNWKAAAWYLTFKAKHPQPLTEEEKEEQHQARLAEERRSAEATRTWMEEMRGPSLLDAKPRKGRSKKG